MIKIDIVKQLAKEFNLKDKDAHIIVDLIMESLKETILEYKRLEVRDFGVFLIKQRKARIGRNPKDKKEYPIPSRKVVVFKSGKEIKTV